MKKRQFEKLLKQMDLVDDPILFNRPQRRAYDLLIDRVHGLHNTFDNVIDDVIDNVIDDVIDGLVVGGPALLFIDDEWFD